MFSTKRRSPFELIEDDHGDENEIFREEPIQEFNPRFRVIISNGEQ